MKNLISLLILIAAIPTFAASDVVDSFERTVPGIGRMVLTVTRPGSAIKYHVLLTIACIDQRKTPNLLKPTDEIALNEDVCAYGVPQYNEATTELLVQATSPGSANSGPYLGGPQWCPSPRSWGQKFNLTQFCSPWR